MKKKKMKKWIPKNTMYCYKFIGLLPGGFGHRIKTCPWYRYGDEDVRECKYLGFRGYDFCLYDQCKICDEHLPKE